MNVQVCVCGGGGGGGEGRWLGHLVYDTLLLLTSHKIRLTRCGVRFSTTMR